MRQFMLGLSTEQLMNDNTRVLSTDAPEYVHAIPLMYRANGGESTIADRCYMLAPRSRLPYTYT